MPSSALAAMALVVWFIICESLTIYYYVSGLFTFELHSGAERRRAIADSQRTWSKTVKAVVAPGNSAVYVQEECNAIS